MKIISIAVCCLIPVVVFAQNPMGMNQQDMEKMMQQMQKAQACMEKVDKSVFEGLEQKQKQFEAEMKSLCSNGKRGQAQDKAIAYAKDMMSNPSIKQMRKCGEMMQGMMQKMPFIEQDTDYSSQHVCDSGM